MDVGKAQAPSSNPSLLGSEAKDGTHEIVSRQSEEQRLFHNGDRASRDLLQADGLLDGAQIGFHVPAQPIQGA
jgi:hypothetical protein